MFAVREKSGGLVKRGGRGGGNANKRKTLRLEDKCVTMNYSRFNSA